MGKLKKMKGRMIEIFPDEKYGKVSTENDEVGVLTVYFNDNMEELKVGNTIEFESCESMKIFL